MPTEPTRPDVLLLYIISSLRSARDTGMLARERLRPAERDGSMESPAGRFSLLLWAQTPSNLRGSQTRLGRFLYRHSSAQHVGVSRFYSPPFSRIPPSPCRKTRGRRLSRRADSNETPLTRRPVVAALSEFRPRWPQAHNASFWCPPPRAASPSAAHGAEAGHGCSGVPRV